MRMTKDLFTSADDIEALRKICLAYLAWNNDVLLPALQAAGVE